MIRLIKQKSLSKSKFYDIKNIDDDSINIYKSELKILCTIPEYSKIPYFPHYFTHLMDDSVRKWLFLGNDEIYPKIQDECSLHILIHSLLLTIMSAFILTYNGDSYNSNDASLGLYLYNISGTISLTLVFCAIANNFIIITNLNKQPVYLIRYSLAKNIKNITWVFRQSAIGFYAFVLFTILAFFVIKPFGLNIICLIIFGLTCFLFSSPGSISDKINIKGNPRQSLNFYSWDNDLREISKNDLIMMCYNLIKTNEELTSLVNEVMIESKLINENEVFENNV